MKNHGDTEETEIHREFLGVHPYSPCLRGKKNLNHAKSQIR